MLAIVLLIVAVIAAAVVGFAVAAVALVAAVAAFVAREVIRRRLATANRVTAFTEGTLQAADIEAATPPDNFRVTERALPGGAAPVTPAPGAAAAARTDAEAVLLFRQASAEAMREISAPAIEPPMLQAVALSEVRKKLARELSPAKTFADSFRGRLRFPPGKVRQPPGDDPIEPVMAAPKFPQPMYKPLAELSQDWLLPGLDKILPNTTVVLESNQTLIESYMVGLNHEMARELQWNEYPTDLQGTSFRQFWESQGYVGSADPATLRDIRALNEWRNGHLGANGLRNPDPAAQPATISTGDTDCG